MHAVFRFVQLNIVVWGMHFSETIRSGLAFLYMNRTQYTMPKNASNRIICILHIIFSSRLKRQSNQCDDVTLNRICLAGWANYPIKIGKNAE